MWYLRQIQPKRPPQCCSNRLKMLPNRPSYTPRYYRSLRPLIVIDTVEKDLLFFRRAEDASLLYTSAIVVLLVIAFDVILIAVVFLLLLSRSLLSGSGGSASGLSHGRRPHILQGGGGLGGELAPEPDLRAVVVEQEGEGQARDRQEGGDRTGPVYAEGRVHLRREERERRAE